jgi:hypothetical protein
MNKRKIIEEFKIKKRIKLNVKQDEFWRFRVEILEKFMYETMRRVESWHGFQFWSINRGILWCNGGPIYCGTTLPS